MISVDDQIDILASGAFTLLISKGCSQYHAHLEDHSRLHSLGEFQRVNRLAICGTYHLIITLFHEGMPGSTSAITLNHIVKFLAQRDKWPKTDT
jgi:hypothetical protein